MVGLGDLWHMRARPAPGTMAPRRSKSMTRTGQIIRELILVIALALVVFSPAAIALLAQHR
jgi:hypothetical protein